MDEEILRGGFVNQVVRVGETVRRTAGPWTTTIQRLLQHARERGVDWAPAPHGIDDQGREVLSYLEGEVPHDMPDWIWSEPVLLDVARALRQWHDATRDFDTTSAVWNFESPEPAEVICHHDFAPYNCVFRDQQFVGAIDFDFCSPGPRIWDLAYTAYRYVPLMPPTGSIAGPGAQETSRFSIGEMGRRLDHFLDTYAGSSTALRVANPTMVSATIKRLRAIADWTEQHSAKENIPEIMNHAAMYRAHADWLAATDLTN